MFDLKLAIGQLYCIFSLGYFHSFTLVPHARFFPSRRLFSPYSLAGVSFLSLSLDRVRVHLLGHSRNQIWLLLPSKHIPLMEGSNSDRAIDGLKEQEEEGIEEEGSRQELEGQKPHLRKEPSFSRWCKDGNPSTEISLADADSEEFDLPFLNENFSEREISDSGAGGRAYSSFDVENGLHGEFGKSDGRSISPLFVLKILMYTLIWYTLSTCLTL